MFEPPENIIAIFVIVDFTANFIIITIIVITVPPLLSGGASFQTLPGRQTRTATKTLTCAKSDDDDDEIKMTSMIVMMIMILRSSNVNLSNMG